MEQSKIILTINNYDALWDYIELLDLLLIVIISKTERGYIQEKKIKDFANWLRGAHLKKIQNVLQKKQLADEAIKLEFTSEDLQNLKQCASFLIQTEISDQGGFLQSIGIDGFYNKYEIKKNVPLTPTDIFIKDTIAFLKLVDELNAGPRQ